ncbi:hypothetical protein WR25_04694 isoform A [Diploscapter pachys]|uniref:Uncharacterized protein n=1 Tax=Diploscapter pachys TaxID=2018661 RepID=A0A2A2J624_9BILA|nr:hypothetical protein WR25_04694 isoform A [Diploscapter pachys]
MDDTISNTSTASNDSLAIRRRNLVTVIILLCVNLLNYMDRFTVVGVMPALQEYFQMNNKQMGLLQTIFITFYMLFAPLCGYLGDRYNRKLIMVAGVTVWIIAVLASSFVPPGWYKTFLFLRGVVGVGEASYSTIAPTIIADLFTGAARSRVLMVFYFAIPVGSGMGFIAGSNISLYAGTWKWGIRFTPILGIFCLLMIIFVLQEPTRGGAEHARIETESSIKEDLRYLAHVRTFHLTTVGQTAVIFAVGAISWRAPIFMGDAYSLSYGYAPDTVKARNELIFGVITCVAGISGLVLGSAIAQRWRSGLYPFSHPSHEADALVCGFASLASIPFFYMSLMVSASSINFTWFILFISITLMCMNWAVNMDILMYVIVANRRATAAAFQVMICHLFGDATSPYIVGVISDAVRGDDKSAVGEYYSLRTALFVPTFTLVLSAAAYLTASFTLDDDRKKALDEMGVEDDWRDEMGFDDDVETLIPHMHMHRDDSYGRESVDEQPQDGTSDGRESRRSGFDLLPAQIQWDLDRNPLPMSPPRPINERLMSDGKLEDDETAIPWKEAKESDEEDDIAENLNETEIRVREVAQPQYDFLEGLDLKRMMKDLTFVRIEFDHIDLPTGNAFLTSLVLSKSLAGFFLDYSIPCPSNVAGAKLSQKERVADKGSTEECIEFKHRRVPQVALTEDIVNFWAKSVIRFELYVRYNKSGKFQTRLIGKCLVPLQNLTSPPFSINNRFNFTTVDPNIPFDGVAQISICLGSRIQTLNERLRLARKAWDMRFNQNEGIHIPHESQSRSSSRCRSHTPERGHRNGERSEHVEYPLHRGRSVQRPAISNPVQQRPPNQEWLQPKAPPPFRERFGSNTGSEMGSDFALMPSDRPNFEFAQAVYNHPINQHMARYPSMERRLFYRTGSQLSSEECQEGRDVTPRKASIQLTIHSARFLPPVVNQWGHLVAPNAFVSVLGRDGELRSQVHRMERNPNWEWTARLTISGERRNLVVKFMHHGPEGDKPLAILTIPLPIVDASRALFELTDISGSVRHTGESPQTMISLKNLDATLFRQVEPERSQHRSAGHYEFGNENAQSDEDQRPYRIRRLTPTPSHSPPVRETSEELQAKLK